MSKEISNEKFWDIADTFIHLANKHMDNFTASEVNSALLFATSRFNAFVVASDENADLSEEEAKTSIAKFFSSQYEKMLLENLTDYEKNLSATD